MIEGASELIDHQEARAEARNARGTLANTFPSNQMSLCLEHALSSRGCYGAVTALLRPIYQVLRLSENTRKHLDYTAIWYFTHADRLTGTTITWWRETLVPAMYAPTLLFSITNVALLNEFTTGI